jgi:alpha-beta hydrolase superfamily lysophospholipase
MRAISALPGADAVRKIASTWNSPSRWILLLGLAILLLVVAGLVGFILRFQKASTPAQPPAFYAPPDPLPAGNPGAIIRSEPLPDSLPEGAQAFRVMYLSTGVDGEPVAVTGTIVARRDPGDTPRPVIAWAHGTTGIFPQCGVSHTTDPYQQTPIIERMLSEGYVVAITDYPGLGTPGVHPYMVGPIEAASVLDSVRAARQLNVNAGDRFAVWGASQGGHAALWTAQTAAEYAPELTLVGAAASAPATDLGRIVESKLSDKAGGIFLGYVFRAWSALYPEANLDAIIKPEMRQQFEAMVQPCFTTPAAFLKVGDIVPPDQYLSVDILKTEPWASLMAQNTPRGPIDVPLLIAHGTADPLIPIELSEAEAARRCADGEDVQFARFPGSVHDAREDTALMILGWVEDRFAGRPTGANCE